METEGRCQEYPGLSCNLQLQVLRCEMARKNMYIRDDAAAAAKRGRVGGEYNPYATAPTASPAAAYYTPAPVITPAARAEPIPININRLQSA